MADKKKKQYTNEGMDKSYRRLYSFVKPLFMILFPFRKIHAENIPEGKVLICPNHFSDLDGLLLCAQTQPYSGHGQAGADEGAHFGLAPAAGRHLWGQPRQQ